MIRKVHVFVVGSLVGWSSLAARLVRGLIIRSQLAGPLSLDGRLDSRLY